MAFKTCKRLCKVQDCVSKSTNSILFRLPFLFRGLNKFADAQVSLSRPFNILVIAFADVEALAKVYLNEKMQDIIQAIIEARPATVEDPCKCLFKACFPDIYKSDNHIAYYNFY